MASDTPTPVHLVLGATGGVGSTLARRLKAEGATVVLAGRDPDRLAALGSELGAHTITLDARDPDAIQAAAKEAVAEAGRLDGIANCVGSLALLPAHRTSLDVWNDTLATNLTSAFGAVKAAATTMRKTGGSVVLVTSAAGRTGMANHEAIAAAKAGIAGLMRSAASTYAAYGIRVNAVAPGLTETPMTEAMLQAEATRKASTSMHALRRLGRAEDIAGAIAFLLDPSQSWITGQELGVDGGLATVRPRGG
ncbi:MAG: SDR family oxidoreductase [Planctomycetota bacterium]|nr:SDR family oxidoreductase [Planctomycetota bacterium]